MQINQVFELTMVLDNEKFQEILSLSYGETDFNKDKYIDCSLEDNGILIGYRNSQYKKKVKIIVNTAVLLQSEKVKPTKLIHKLEKHIHSYFHLKYKLSDFDLTEATLMTDISMDNQEKLTAYLKVFQRIGKVKGFSPVDYEGLDTAFCLEGNSNDISFLIYDLQEAIKNRVKHTKKCKSMIDNYKGLLRIEVRLTKPKAIRAFIGDASPTEQIASLSEQCKDIFLTAITKIIPYGDFYKKEDALEIIHREIQDAVLRRRMIRLVALIPEKKSLLLAQKELNYRHVDIIMDAFAKINLCPVTISKRQEIKHLENFYDYLC